MAKAKKLPSGNWRIRIYSHTDAQGKKHYESFTAPTKQQAEILGAKFAADIDRSRSGDITLSECVERYIKSNTGVLSPSTIDGYIKDARRFAPVANLRIRKLSTKDIQDFITGLSARLSPKSVMNTWGLLKSALKFSGIDKDFKIHLPKNPKQKLYAPSGDDVTRLYQNANDKLKLCIALAAFHGLRRGEISALKFSDLQENTLYIHSDIVRGVDGWVHKETPKTSASNRMIYISDSVKSLIGTGEPDSYIVGLLPSSIGTDFYNLKKRLGIKGIRFHDLRSYFASVAVAMGISDIYLAHLGGWKETSQVMKRHYQKPIQEIDKAYAEKLNNHFDDMTQNMSQDKEKPQS